MASSDKVDRKFPLANLTHDGRSTEDLATASCFCGEVQLEFPTAAPGLVDSFVCHCSDCHKITASMFASNFIVDDKYLKHVRGQEKLKTFAQSKTIASGNTMTNYFCGNCGTLMYRVSSGYPGMSITRIGTIDDFELMETKFKPRIEQFVKQRSKWLKEVEGAEIRTQSGGPLGEK
ncbi:hypothetical protein ANO11243_090770 [Dothideomycetidae sp. 11243]|nr:hypothetical protein ANO11243_090770 [fungal sp. No.11243]